mmetsp:Transcript_18280/g.37037  ORF Transcript_18280/g.37037 Transcript_18280/m.37037 type:complete len:224 (+) Transcript_18280:4562-5233(+)
MPFGLPLLYPHPPAQGARGEGSGAVPHPGFSPITSGQATVCGLSGVVLSDREADLGVGGGSPGQGVHSTRTQAIGRRARLAPPPSRSRTLLHSAVAFQRGSGGAALVSPGVGRGGRYQHLAYGAVGPVRAVAVARRVGRLCPRLHHPVGHRHVEVGRGLPARRGVPGSCLGQGRDASPYQYLGVSHGAASAHRDGGGVAGSPVPGMVRQYHGSAGDQHGQTSL